MALTFKQIFFDHPAEIGESYFEHQKNAVKISFLLFKLSLIVIIHAIFPCLFTNTGSEKIKKLNQKLLARNN